MLIETVGVEKRMSFLSNPVHGFHEFYWLRARGVPNPNFRANSTQDTLYSLFQIVFNSRNRDEIV